MMSRRKLNHTAAGLLDKFIGRNNDYHGYWALGALYQEARASGNRVELDLLAATAQPSAPACTELAQGWAHALRLAIGRHKVSMDELAQARIAIAFGLPPVPKRPGHIGHGDPFLCSLHLTARDGRVAERRRMGHCKPADVFRGRRRGRHAG